MSYSIKSIREEFKNKGIFYTTPELIDFMYEYIPSNLNPLSVYDPTCGHGALLRGLPDEVKKYGQDINDVAVNACQDIPNSDIRIGDTLSNPNFIDKKFELILANPPFSVNWERVHYSWIPKDIPALPPKSKADYAFILHCLHCLADNGIAIIMNFPGILYRGQSEGKIRKWLVDNNYIERVVLIPGGKFEDTSIATALLILRKNKTNQDIIFEDEDEERTVSIQDVIENNYVLSVSNYIEKEVEKEEINPCELEQEARNSLLTHIDKSLSFSFESCKIIGGTGIDPLLDNISDLVDSWRQRIRNEIKDRNIL